MDIREWTIKQIKNLIANYDRLNRTEGGPFSRAESMLELERRAGGDFDGYDVTKVIPKIQDNTENELVRYRDIWAHYFPEKPWTENYSGRIVGRALHAAAYYCAFNNLPIVTALVSQANGRVTDQAKQNMFDNAENWGVASGTNAADFYEINITKLQTPTSEKLS